MAIYKFALYPTSSNAALAFTSEPNSSHSFNVIIRILELCAKLKYEVVGYLILSRCVDVDVDAVDV